MAEKKHEFLICADSDGCVMDVMDVKHKMCFAPCFIEVFGLGESYDEAYEVWQNINLYSKTRGVNRFKTCLLALQALNVEIEGLDAFADFCANSKELSNRALEALIWQNPSPCLVKALEWSINTNKSIAALAESTDTAPFPNAKDALYAASAFCDLAAVSSANRMAVETEWEHHGFTAFVGTLLSQEAGSKSHCIKTMLELGYEPENVIMIGDAPGDLDAARANNVWFYPILIGHEAESWAKFRDEVLPALKNGAITQVMQEQWINEFNTILHI